MILILLLSNLSVWKLIWCGVTLCVTLIKYIYKMQNLRLLIGYIKYWYRLKHSVNNWPFHATTWRVGLFSLFRARPTMFPGPSSLLLPAAGSGLPVRTPLTAHPHLPAGTQLLELCGSSDPHSLKLKTQHKPKSSFIIPVIRRCTGETKITIIITSATWITTKSPLRKLLLIPLKTL